MIASIVLFLVILSTPIFAAVFFGHRRASRCGHAGCGRVPHFKKEPRHPRLKTYYYCWRHTPSRISDAETWLWRRVNYDTAWVTDAPSSNVLPTAAMIATRDRDKGCDCEACSGNVAATVSS